MRELIDARLLTSYEVREDEHEPTRRVEIIHESLLANWPRLVRWMTQDQEGVQLREELRQAARSWDEHGRHDDRLWTGTPYREFRLWQEHYPGGLTGVEEAYAAAMTRHSTRRRRRRRLAATVVFIALLAVLLVVAVSRQQAVAETNRAEAARLVLLGLNADESDHTAALAFATASLARADTPAGRRLALRALWAGPPATVVSDDGGWELAFSHDGRLVAVGGGDGLLRVFSREGGPPVTVQGFDEDDGTIWDLSFSQDDRYLIGAALVGGGEVRVWETTDWQLHRTLQGPERPRIFPEMPEIDLAFGHFEPDGSAILTVRLGSDGDGEPSPLDETGEWFVRRWPLNGGPSELVGRVSGTVANIPVIDMNRRLLATGIRNELFLHHIDSLGHESPKVIGRNPAPFIWFGLAFDPVHPRLAACDVGGNLRVWSIGGNGSRSERNLKIPWSPFGSTFSPDGALLAQASERWGAQLWDLEGPALSEPWSLGVEATGVREVAFTPDGSWLATAAGGQQPYRLALWPLANDYPRVQLHPESGLDKVRFHPDGSRVFAVVTGRDGVMTIRSWPMTGGAGIEPTVHFRGGEIWEYVVDPLWRFLIVGAGGAVQMVPLDGSEPTIIEGPHRGGLDIDRTGRFLAYKHNESVILHDLESGDQHRFEALGDGPLNSWFLDQPGRVVATRGRVVSRWDPLTGKVETLSTNSFSFAAPLGDGDLLYVRNDEAHAIGLRSVFDTRDGSVTPLPAVHQPPGMISFDWTGSLVRSSHPDGEIRVGPLFSDEPHLLLGHDQEIARGIFSPDGKWIATWASDGTLRLWPVPDLAKPPFHTLPYDELMAKLKALTNLRAVPDPDSHTGYSVKPDFSAYQGWAEVPEW